MNYNAKFRGVEVGGKNSTKVWKFGFIMTGILGTFLIDENHAFPSSSMNTDFDEVDTESVGQFIGIRDEIRKRDVYSGDVYFEEREHDHGDNRIFFIVTWVKEWSSFLWLSFDEYLTYNNKGISALDADERYDLGDGDMNRLHYFGTVFERFNEIY